MKILSELKKSLLTLILHFCSLIADVGKVMLHPQHAFYVMHLGESASPHLV